MIENIDSKANGRNQRPINLANLLQGKTDPDVAHLANNVITRRTMLGGSAVALLLLSGSVAEANQEANVEKDRQPEGWSKTKNSETILNEIPEAISIPKQGTTSAGNLFSKSGALSVAVGLASSYAVTASIAGLFYRISGGERLGCLLSTVMFSSIIGGSFYLASYASNPTIGRIAALVGISSLIAYAFYPQKREDFSKETVEK